MLTTTRLQSDRSLPSKSPQDQIMARGCDKPSQTIQSRFDILAINDTHAESQRYLHGEVEDVVHTAVQKSLQGSSIAVSAPSVRSRPSMRAAPQDFHQGPNHNTSPTSEDVKGIGAWALADHSISGLVHGYDVSPVIDLDDPNSTTSRGTTAPQSRTTGAIGKRTMWHL